MMKRDASRTTTRDQQAPGSGLCELNICGVERLCGGHSSLISSLGFVFQQIREGKVRVSC